MHLATQNEVDMEDDCVCLVPPKFNQIGVNSPKYGCFTLIGCERALRELVSVMFL